MKWLVFALPAVVQLALALRMAGTGLARRYPAFTFWITLSALGRITLGLIENRPPTYFLVWLGIQTGTSVALFAALVELTRLILEHYPGLKRLTARTLFVLLALAAILAASREEVTKPSRFATMLFSGFEAASSIFVMALVSLASYLDPRRRKNVILHERLFAANCAVSAILLLFAVSRYESKEWSTWAGATAAVVLPLCWMRLNPAGEVDRRPSAPPTSQTETLPQSEAAIQRLEKLVTRSIE
ncbi:MAG: hypothetical protein K2X03_30230 [Bryobacteraceae bacterium]|nr:hypothetical protein [Bryobacteraceae bacterium]